MQRARTLVWAPHAIHDLRAIWRYYARVASAELADRLLREIAAAATRLERDPLPGRDRDELRTGLRSLLVHPHTIFYRIHGDEAQVVRVLHERRDFPAILGESED